MKSYRTRSKDFISFQQHHFLFSTPAWWSIGRAGTTLAWLAQHVIRLYFRHVWHFVRLHCTHWHVEASECQQMSRLSRDHTIHGAPVEVYWFEIRIDWPIGFFTCLKVQKGGPHLVYELVVTTIASLNISLHPCRSLCRGIWDCDVRQRAIFTVD